VSIGEVLVEARHRRGFTVAEVSHYTRVRESIIRAIEQDDYLLSGSDAHARRDIRVIAVALGLDPTPLIGAFDAAHPSVPELTPAGEVRPTIPFGRVGRDGSFGRVPRRRFTWIPVLAVLVLAGVGFAVYHFFFAGPASSSSATASRSASAAPSLTPVRVEAFGPDGISNGDHPQLARLAADGNPATAWTTDRFGTAHIVGTGLLLDMGHEVTITSAEVTLGTVPGAGFQLRMGNTPSLAHLTVEAVANDASGALGVRLSSPVHARYVLIWFTSLPPTSSGSSSFQASLYNVSVQDSSS
jgi:cytoskeletal protein RodZ